MSVLRLTIAVLFVLAAGCRDQRQSALDKVKSELSRIPVFVHGNRCPARAFYTTLQRRISELPGEDRLKAFIFFEDILETPDLNDTNLSERQQSLEVYLDAIKTMVSIFERELENPEPAWKFLVFAIGVFDWDREIVSSSAYDPHIPSSGLCLDKEQYLFELDGVRSRTIVEWFERGAFCRFFWRLPIDERKKWLSWLDFMARRKIDIRNPSDPGETATLRFVRLPPRIPEFVAERRNRKNDFTKTARTLPAVYSNEDL